MAPRQKLLFVLTSWESFLMKGIKTDFYLPELVHPSNAIIPPPRLPFYRWASIIYPTSNHDILSHPYEALQYDWTVKQPKHNTQPLSRPASNLLQA
ncbi:hypothetical protein BKA61DRAFT_674073 [Leptodontidium sp. MPI-SDFR-AT-0119]|nr:hypothetical protein BKA61DRAFT_674073 [Leptodontidium sp. MPI-SDFR-AT-0119]